MRAIWSGHIQFSIVNIPIKLYGAVESAATIRFNQIHKEDNGRIGYDKKCKKCNEVVSGDDIVKGYQFEPDQYVIMDAEDFDKVKLKTTKVIELEAFVDEEDVHPALFDTPYFAGPDGPIGAKSYALFRETLRSNKKLALGRVVLRDREHVMLISAHEHGLLMYKLRYPNELRQMKHVPQIEEGVVNDDELGLASVLVERMSKKFDELELKDRYHEALVELVESKIEGKEIIAVEHEEKPTEDIMAALKAAVEQTEAKPMKKATGKAKAKAKTTKAKKTG